MKLTIDEYVFIYERAMRELVEEGKMELSEALHKIDCVHEYRNNVDSDWDVLLKSCRDCGSLYVDLGIK